MRSGLTARTRIAKVRPAGLSRLLGVHPFELHLTEPRGRGPVPDGAFVGSAGGAACGDLVRIAVCVRATARSTHVTFDAEGCGATLAAGSACVALVRGADACSTPRGSRRRRHRRGARRPVARKAPRRRPRRRRPAPRARARWPRSDIRLARPDAEPRPGRPQRRRRQRGRGASAARRTGHEVVAVTLKLWADQEGGRRAQLLLAAGRARPPARWPTRWASRTSRSTSRTASAATVVDDYLAEHAAGRTPNPCVRCNGLVRFDAMLALADRLGAAALATGHYARIADDGEGPLLARAADPAQGPDLHARRRCGPSCSGACASRSATSPSPRCARSRARPACRSPRSARARTSASWPAPAASASSPATRGVEDTPGRRRRHGGRVLGRHRGQHRFTVGQRKGLRRRRRRAAVRGLDGRRRQPRRRRAARRARHPHASPRAGHACCTATGSRVDRVKLRYRSEPVPLHACAGDEHRDPRSRTPVAGVAPGQTACLMDGDRVVGHGTIAGINLRCMPPRSSAEIRAAFLAVLRGARPPARAVGLADPRVLRPVGAAHDRGHAAASSRTSWARRSRRTRASPPARSASARPTSTRSATPPATSRSSRCSATSRSATTSRRARSSIAWELSTQVFGLDPEQIWITVFEGDPELGLGPDEEAIELLAGDRRARGAHRAAAALGELLAGRADRARAGPAPSSTSTAGPTSAAGRAARATTPSATSSTGTSCSCSTRCTRTARLEPLPEAQHRHRAWASSGWRRSSRTSPRSTRPTSSARWSSWASSCRAAATARTRSRPRRCACWPTTAAR